MSVFDDVNNTQVWSANDKTVRSLVGKGKCFPHPLVPISTVIPHLAFFFSATLHNRVILCPALSVSPRLEGSFYIPLAHSSECTTETMLSPEDPEKLAMIKPFNCIKSSLHFIQMLKKQKETWNWRKWHQELQPLIPRLSLTRQIRPVGPQAGKGWGEGLHLTAWHSAATSVLQILLTGKGRAPTVLRHAGIHMCSDCIYSFALAPNPHHPLCTHSALCEAPWRVPLT